MFPKVLIFRAGSNVISKLISWQTDSDYSHAALMFEDCVVEAMQGEGVRKLRWEDVDWSRVEVYQVRGMSIDAALKVRRFVDGELGKGYDYWGLVRFISRRRLPDNDKWFCSELVFAGLQAGGINLLERIEPYKPHPGDLRTSPLLIPEN